MAAKGAAALCIGRHAICQRLRELDSTEEPPLLRIPFRSSLHVTRRGVTAVHSASMAEPLASKKDREREESPENWMIKMLYDGDCLLCMRKYSTIKFVDVSSADYWPEDNQGLDYQTVMGRIHAILADGTIVTDVKAFRRLYERVGLRRVYATTKYEPIKSIADAVCGVWAKQRLQLTGRPPMDEIMESRRKDKGEVCNDRSKCEM